MAQKAVPQHVGHGGGAQRQSRMPRVRLLDRVYRQEPDGVDAQLVERVLRRWPLRTLVANQLRPVSRGRLRDGGERISLGTHWDAPVRQHQAAVRKRLRQWTGSNVDKRLYRMRRTMRGYRFLTKLTSRQAAAFNQRSAATTRPPRRRTSSRNVRPCSLSSDRIASSTMVTR